MILPISRRTKKQRNSLTLPPGTKHKLYLIDRPGRAIDKCFGVEKYDCKASTGRGGETRMFKCNLGSLYITQRISQRGT